MRGTNNRNIRVLGGAWLVLGVVAFARALLGIAEQIIDPSGAADWVDHSLGMAFLGSVHLATGGVLLRRVPKTRPILAISSFVLLIWYVLGATNPPEYDGAGRISAIGSVPPLLVLGISLWFTSWGRGKQALERYMAKANG